MRWTGKKSGDREAKGESLLESDPLWTDVELSNLGAERGGGVWAATKTTPLIRGKRCGFERNLVTGFGCAELEPWNSRKGSGLEVKFGKPLSGSVGSNQESEWAC